MSAHSLRTSDTMALLCKQVDSDIIRLMARWRSDEMLCYLHLQAKPILDGFAEKMLEGGNYSLLPRKPGLTPLWVWLLAGIGIFQQRPTTSGCIPEAFHHPLHVCVSCCYP